MKKEIVWEYTAYRYEPENHTFKENEDEEDYESFNDEPVSPLDELLSGDNFRRIANTPVGQFLVDDSMNPYKLFTFWLGATNFDISKSVAKEIEDTPGIEILEIISRYTFLIAVGRAFNIREIRTAISEKLCGVSPVDEKIREDIAKLQEELDESYKDYVIYEFPNGNVEFVGLKFDESNKEEFLNKVDLFGKAKELSNGRLIRSNKV